MSCSRSSNLLLATTTSAYDTGLLSSLLPPFEQAYNIKVKVIAVGTGQALELGRRGDADVLLVHAPLLEEEFIAQGYGRERRPVMSNDFVLLGPTQDPAGIRGLGTMAALQRIAQQRAFFVSRGDGSGTHLRERELWQRAGMEPEGSWYLSAGQGMGETLTLASEKGAYTLSDRSTYLAQQKRLRLAILVEGGVELFNPYSVITVNPDRYPKVNYKGARKLLEYLTSLQAQRIIEGFGAERFGQPLFRPWKGS